MGSVGASATDPARHRWQLRVRLASTPPSLEFRVGEGDLDLSEDTSQGVKSQQVSPFKVAGRVGPSAPSYFPHFADLISQAFPAPVSAADLLGLRQQRSMWQRRSRGGAVLSLTVIHQVGFEVFRGDMVGVSRNGGQGLGADRGDGKRNGPRGGGPFRWGQKGRSSWVAGGARSA
jgi:hypothetical protein